MRSKSSKLQFVIYLIFILFLILDTVHSCRQFYSSSLDGDMPESILPTPSMIKTMEDPLGIKTVIEKDYHHNPNRFFSHWIFQKSFRNLPVFFQNFTTPINSVYASCTFSKIITQVLLVMLLCWCIKGNMQIISKDFILIAILMVPLFQSHGWPNIRVIDHSVSYTFFYALPIIFLIIYFLPLIFEFFFNKKIKMSLPIKLLWIPLAILVCFSGPLNPAIVLIVALMLVVQRLFIGFRSNSGNFLKKFGQSIRMIPHNYYFYLIPICVLSLYSLYVGTFNSAAFWEVVPLGERYARLPKGLFLILTSKMPYLCLSIVFIINIILIATKYRSAKGKKILQAFAWVGVFSLIYIALLPFGGYRPARPFIIRYDTFLPVILFSFFLFGISTFYIIKSISNRNEMWYFIVIVAFITTFTLADMKKENNSCQRQNLQTIAQSEEEIVRLPNDCITVTWLPISQPEESRAVGELLYLWRITDQPKFFYNEPE